MKGRTRTKKNLKISDRTRTDKILKISDLSVLGFGGPWNSIQNEALSDEYFSVAMTAWKLWNQNFDRTLQQLSLD